MLPLGVLGISIPNPLHAISSTLGGVASGIAGDVISQVASAIASAVGKLVAALGTLWVRVGTPNLTLTSGGASASDPVAFLQGHLYWYMTALAVAGVLVGSGRMAWQRRGGPGQDVLKGLLVYVAISGAGVAGIALLVSAADDFASWIISQSLNGTDFAQNITVLLGLTGASALSGNFLGPILVIVLGLVALLASVIQIFLMVVRGGMLVILAGILPTAAAAGISGAESSKHWLKKNAAWLVAFILYKPAAAIVYAVAFRLVGSHVFGAGGIVGVITGLSLMVLALIALPALMRFVTPLVASVASGGAGGVMAAGAAAAMTMPTGAIRTRASQSAANGSGSSAGSGPAGATGAGQVGAGAVGGQGSGEPGASARNGAAGAQAPAGASALSGNFLGP
ncbi:MAG: hypothetical protein ACR2LV_05450, partial [Solirubrobacteraceae bacterium]